jgi:hypothetical protein
MEIALIMFGVITVAVIYALSLLHQFVMTQERVAGALEDIARKLKDDGV